MAIQRTFEISEDETCLILNIYVKGMMTRYHLYDETDIKRVIKLLTDSEESL